MGEKEGGRDKEEVREGERKDGVEKKDEGRGMEGWEWREGNGNGGKGEEGEVEKGGRMEWKRRKKEWRGMREGEEGEEEQRVVGSRKEGML